MYYKVYMYISLQLFFATHLLSTYANPKYLNSYNQYPKSLKINYFYELNFFTKLAS